MFEPRPRAALRSRFVVLSIVLNVVVILLLVALPRGWRIWVAVAVVDHLLLVAGSLWPRASLVGPNLSRLSPTAGKDAIGLTFDDGPDPEVTPEVLRILDERGARATFFCIGRRVERHPDLVAEIRRRGHGVENHSYRHLKAFCFLLPGSLARDIDRGQSAVRSSAGEPPRYFRAPAGLRNPWLDPVLASRGLELVSWSRRGFDTVTRDAGRVARRILRRMSAGDIVLLHDGSCARGEDGRPVVIDALVEVLDELDRRGLRAIAIPRPGQGGSDRP